MYFVKNHENENSHRKKEHFFYYKSRKVTFKIEKSNIEIRHYNQEFSI